MGVGRFIVNTVIGITAIVALTTAVAILCGFSTTGIAAGSTAAGIQASIGNVTAGSTFAILQSAGATGLLVKACFVSSTILAAVVVLKKKIEKKIDSAIDNIKSWFNKVIAW